MVNEANAHFTAPVFIETHFSYITRFKRVLYFRKLLFSINECLQIFSEKKRCIQADSLVLKYSLFIYE